MTFLEKLREKLDPELMAQVEDAVGDDFSWDVVPRTRLNKVIGQRNALQTKLDAIDTKGHADDDDDDIIDNPPAAKKPAAKAKGAEGTDVEALKAQHATELSNVAKRYAVLDKLRAEGAKDPALVISQLDLDKITLKEDESLEGFDEIFTPWKESHSYMFGTDSNPDDNVPAGTGKGGEGADDDADDPFEAVIASYGK